MAFRKALLKSQQYTTTENEAKALATTQPASMEEQVHGRTAFYFKSVRSCLENKPQFKRRLAEAWAESPRDTLRLIFNLRNCRFSGKNKTKNGKGERDLFRLAVEWLVESGKTEFITCNLENVPFYGRFDDLFYCGDLTRPSHDGFVVMARQLFKDYKVVRHWLAEEKKDGLQKPACSLAAKWAPSVGKSDDKKIGAASKTIKAMQMVLREEVQRLEGLVRAELKDRTVQLNPTSLTAVQDQLPAELVSEIKGLFALFPVSFKHQKGQGKAAKGRLMLLFREVEYRKMLGCLRTYLKVVEKLLATGRTDQIDFNAVPAGAMHLYGKQHMKKGGKPGAFMRHCETSFTKWRDGLAKGVDVDGKVVKINASQLYPHDVVRNYLGSGFGYGYSRKPLDDMVEAQWKELIRNTKEGIQKSKEEAKRAGRVPRTLEKVLFMPDISGSMSGTPLEVAVSLSLLGAECCTGEFHRMFLSFSSRPRLHTITGDSLYDQVQSVVTSEVGYDTNFQAAFDAILATGCSQEDMPEMVIAVSDMEFNTSNVQGFTNYEAIKQKYEAKGYQMPTLVFWNVRSSSTHEQFPVSADENGTILVSGFSPSILSSIVDSPAELTPWAMIRRIIDDPEYDRVRMPGDASMDVVEEDTEVMES